jgi:protein phosphatase
MSCELLDFLWSGFEAVLSCPESDLSAIGTSIPLPQFTAGDVTALCRLATAHFTAQPMVVRLDGELCVVGDIHGTLHDLLRILADQGLEGRYLFLGDYVDRGAFSLEVVTLLFVLMLRRPGRFTLLRGNHEVRKVCAEYGFRDELVGSGYLDEVFDAFCGAFAWMPVAAVVQGAYFCVHGGIGPGISTVEEIEALQRPIHADTDQMAVRMLLWADPVDIPAAFVASGRGGAVSYGALAVRQFLQANGLRAIIRAHQCVNGVQPMRAMPVFTVFSSSNYVAEQPNDAGILLVAANRCLTARTFPGLPRCARAECSFFSYARSDDDARHGMTLSHSAYDLETSHLPRLAVRSTCLSLRISRKTSAVPGVARLISRVALGGTALPASSSLTCSLRSLVSDRES